MSVKSSGRLVAVCCSATTGVKKTPVTSARLQPDHGIEGDGHAGNWHRQVSLLAQESINKMRALGLDVGPGDFAENLTTEGIDLLALPLGTFLRVGAKVVLEITQKGKDCHTRCAIFRAVGDCVMPREGVFARVVEGGEIKAGDGIEVIACDLERRSQARGRSESHMKQRLPECCVAQPPASSLLA